MLRKFLLATSLLLCLASLADAQNAIVLTPPLGANDNRAASTAFVQQATGSSVSITAFGAVADGAADAGTAINSCISAGYDCIVPPSTNGFYINTTIQNTGSIRGSVVKFINPGTTTPTFPGSSFLLCSATVSPCVNNGGNSLPNLGIAAGLSNLIVSRVGGTPAAGVIGIQWNGGYNAASQNVFAYNHDTCFKWFARGVSGISFTGTNVNAAACASHYYVFDGWPEAHFTNGRAGANGSNGDYNSQDFVLFTNTSCSSGGCGPNTVTFSNYYFNPGSNGPACGIRWGNFTNALSSVVGAETRFSNVHIEWHTGGTGVFCSDSTVKTIQQFYMDHVVTAVAAPTPPPLFAFNSATNLTQWFVHDSLFGGCSGITLAPTPLSGSAFSDVHFDHNFGCVGASFTSNGTGGNRLFLSENTWGTLAVAGNWDGQLSSFNDSYSTLTDTATGNISWANPTYQSWAPTLAFGGASTGITYGGGTIGYFSRTSDGGFVTTFSVILTSVGTATGTATISGLPKQCANGAMGSAAGAASGYFLNMSGLTGPPLFAIGSGTTVLNLYTTSGTGTQVAVLTNSNFTNTTQINGTAKCAHTQ